MEYSSSYSPARTTAASRGKREKQKRSSYAGERFESVLPQQIVGATGRANHLRCASQNLVTHVEPTTKITSMF